MMHADKATELFMKGYNCSQATAAAFADVVGIKEEDLLRMMAGFGGGIGGLREQCGAVSAMVFIAGMIWGSYEPEDTTSKKVLYDTVKLMNAEFIDKFGTSCCRDLLSKASCAVKSDPSERTDEYYRKRPCVRFVQAAAEIIEKNMLNMAGSSNPL